jgi:hypothetical protein
MRVFPFAANALGLHYALSIFMPAATIRLTTSHQDVMLNGHVFEARGAVNITDILYTGDGTASNADIRLSSGDSSSASIKAGLGARGLIDGLAIKLEIFDPYNPQLGTFDIMPGATLGNVSEDTNGVLIFSATGRLGLLKAPMCEQHSVACRARLGDTRCRVPLAVDAVARNTLYYKKDTNNSAKPGAWDTWVRVFQSGSFNDRVYECTTQGTTHATTQPTYTTTIGATTTDGTAVFTCRQAFLCAATGQALDFFNIQLTSNPSIDDAISPPWTLGNIIPKSGELQNTRIPIKFYDSGTLIVTTWQPYAPSNFPPGTAFELHPGCDRTFNTCVNVFNNVNNMRATPYAPNSSLVTGRA